MLQKNAERVNKIICYLLALCSCAFLILLVTYSFGIFGFEKKLLYTMIFFGFFSTLSPICLYYLKVPSEILKYYSLIVVAVLIGQLGTFTSIGIYMTYALVPILSCIYYDKKFTFFCSCLCYVMMIYGVWINTASRWEVIYLKYTHLHTFILYFIGFTIEYLIIAIFLCNLVNRSYILLDEQHKAALEAKLQQEKYKLLIEDINDIIFEYNPISKKYSANRSFFDPADEYKSDFIIEDINELIDKKNEKLSDFVKKIISYGSNLEHIEEDFDLSYEVEGKMVPLWYHMQAHLFKDEMTNDEKYIGRFVNITTKKLNENNKAHDKLSSLYMDNLIHRNSLVSKIMSEKDLFTENDYIKMAEFHEFIAEINDYLKFSSDFDEAIMTVFDKVATYLGVDRIAYIAGEVGNKDLECSVKFQWNSNPENMIKSEFSFFSKDDVITISKAYDKYGYIEYNQNFDSFVEFPELKKILDNDIGLKKSFGNQIWMPTISGNTYSGAIFFDKYDKTRYTYAEKFLMVQVVNTVVSYMNRVDAERSNASKSLYLSNMSHEIRTPMNAILGMAEIALKNPMSDELRKCIKTIQSSAQGLLAIINDILDFSKIESGKIDIVCEEYDILSLINDVFVIARERNNSKNLNLIVSYDENIPSRLYGDVVRIKQVMINLANNAIKYTDDGYVDIYIGYEKLYGNKILLNFRVEDSGQGIKEDELNTLFDSYSQANVEKNHHKEGTGLGLTISKQYVELMGGRIFVVSTYGKGSTFSFEIPQEIINGERAGSLNNFNYDNDTVGEHINYTAKDSIVLLVDDNDINIEVATLLFEPIGFTIDIAHDGKEAVNKTHNKKYDLIFMDHFMPVMDGMEASKIIRSEENNQNRETPIIALTADAISGVKEKFFSVGVNDYLTKPIDTVVAYKKIKKWLPKDKVVEG